MNQRYLLGVIAFVTLIAGVVASVYIAPPDPVQQVKYLQLYPQPRALPDFVLTDHQAAPLTKEELLGNWTLVFTGYTYCPDICPTTLAELAKVYPQLSSHTEQLKILFVSVDPGRDTSERLNEYVNFFHSEFVGASGEHKELFPLIRAMGLMYSLSDDTSNPNYLVDHSASVVLINPQAQVIGRFRPTLAPGELAVSDVEQILHDLPLVTS